MAIYNLAFNNSVKQRSAALENYNWTLLIRLIFQTIPSIIKFIIKKLSILADIANTLLYVNLQMK